MYPNIKPIKLKIFIFITALFFAGSSAFAVIYSEQEKRQYKYEMEKKYYNDQYNAWLLYKSEFDRQITDIKTENQKQMDLAKQNYDKLLAEQPGLVAQHTKMVQDASFTVDNSEPVANVTQTSTKTQTVRVVKPSSKPKTATS